MAETNTPPNDDDPDHTPTTHPAHPDLDEIFHAVRHPERRHTLRVLDRTDDPQTVDELAATLAAEPTQGALTDQDAIVVSLTHCHLPLLIDIGLVDRTTNDHVIATDTTANAVRLLDMALVTFN